MATASKLFTRIVLFFKNSSNNLCSVAFSTTSASFHKPVLFLQQPAYPVSTHPMPAVVVVAAFSVVSSILNGRRRGSGRAAPPAETTPSGSDIVNIRERTHFYPLTLCALTYKDI